MHLSRSREALILRFLFSLNWSPSFALRPALLRRLSRRLKRLRPAKPSLLLKISLFLRSFRRRLKSWSLLQSSLHRPKSRRVRRMRRGRSCNRKSPLFARMLATRPGKLKPRVIRLANSVNSSKLQRRVMLINRSHLQYLNRLPPL